MTPLPSGGCHCRVTLEWGRWTALSALFFLEFSRFLECEQADHPRFAQKAIELARGA
jgi:hypothetical protein